MTKDQIFPLIFGLVLGILLMFFWNLGASLNNQNLRLSQLEKAAATNSQNVAEIINLIYSSAPEGEMMETETPRIIE